MGQANQNSMFMRFIRILSQRIKWGYDLENRFPKNILYPSVRPSATHPSVRPLLIRPSVSAFYPNPFMGFLFPDNSIFVCKTGANLKWPLMLYPNREIKWNFLTYVTIFCSMLTLKEYWQLHWYLPCLIRTIFLLREGFCFPEILNISWDEVRRDFPFLRG